MIGNGTFEKQWRRKTVESEKRVISELEASTQFRALRSPCCGYAVRRAAAREEILGQSGLASFGGHSAALEEAELGRWSLGRGSRSGAI